MRKSYMFLPNIMKSWMRWLSLLILLSSCQSLSLTQEGVEVDTLVTETLVQLTSTYTPTGLPATPTSLSVTATTTPTKIPPTFEIYSDMKGCELPCYWGIIPGTTEWGDIVRYFPSARTIEGPFGNDHNRYQLWILNTPGTTYPQGMGISLVVQNGVVASLTTNTNWVHENFDFSLSGVLLELGEPDEIWIRAVANSSDDQPYYTLVLFYPEQGIINKWDGNATKIGDLLKICPKELFSRSTFAPSLVLLPPSKDGSFAEYESHIVGQAAHFIFAYFTPFENITSNYSVMQFYETYSDPDVASCIMVKPTQ